MPCHCAGGWICEQHPDRPWPHPDRHEPDGVCAGPGIPCQELLCPYWRNGIPPKLEPIS